MSSLYADKINSNQQSNTVNITLAKVPKASSVEAIVVSPITLIVTDPNSQEKDDVLAEEELKKKAIEFSERVPPDYYKKEEVANNKSALVGEVSANKISAYLHAPLIPKDEIKSKINSAGFEILASYDLDKKGTVVSFVITNQEMASLAAKEKRGFASTLRLLYDESSHSISISNPLYVMKAFMQDEYNSDVANRTLKRLTKVFTNLTNSEDIIKFTNLEKYQFMENMPYYQDMEVIASGKNDALLQQARKSQMIVYEQHLDNGNTILGVKLSARTSKFVKKIGYQNGGLLPYPVLIENNKATILAPKYYIAIMYPMLSMSNFMSISTVPDAIINDCSKIFR